jgi:thioredoxin-like negative regulator of GroEL
VSVAAGSANAPQAGVGGSLAPPARRAKQPLLLFFLERRSGPCRTTEAYLAQILQRRGNHGTFALQRLDVDERPDLATRFRIDSVPTLIVVEGRRLVARLAAPKSVGEIRRFLEPWLR